MRFGSVFFFTAQASWYCKTLWQTCFTITYFGCHNNYSVTDQQENIEFCFPESLKFCSSWLQFWVHRGKQNYLIPLWDSQVIFFIAIQHLIVIYVINMICDGFTAYDQIVYQTTEFFSKISYCLKALLSIIK